MAKHLAKGAVVFRFGSYANYYTGPQCMSKVIVVHARFAPTHVNCGPPLALSTTTCSRQCVKKLGRKWPYLDWHNQAIEGIGLGPCRIAVNEDCHGPSQKTGPTKQKV